MTCRYSALGFAEWEVSQQTSRAQQCASVVVYLRQRMGLPESGDPLCQRLDLPHLVVGEVVPYAQLADAPASSVVGEVVPYAQLADAPASSDDWHLLHGGSQTMCGDCPGPDTAHIPTQKSARAGGREYYLFAAACDGCLTCVQKLVEVEKVDVFATPRSCKYTALDFAEWEVSQQTSRAPQCERVVAYLRQRMGASRVPPPPAPPRFVDA